MGEIEVELAPAFPITFYFTLGKPAAADLKLGLATAPVLFATNKYPELEKMIARRFSQPGDVEKAFTYVSNCAYRLQGYQKRQFSCENGLAFNFLLAIVLLLGSSISCENG